MPNTRGIAGHQPEKDCGDDETAEDAATSEKYFAVLAFDGDEIGKWISGEKLPPFSTQLADYHDHGKEVRHGALEYFERDSNPDGKESLKDRFANFLKSPRPLSPSYHLQFSEALGNFALLCAGPIVEAFDGRLIYAGGDDVVALMPADTALACAEALRSAFTGGEVQAPDGTVLFRSPAPGFLTSDRWKDDHGRGRPIPFLVPGPAADASVGIAIAHFKAPLQDVVRAAQAAEKRAKNQLGRSAVAVTLFKRSGETNEWGAKWDSGGLDLYCALADA
ncbi:MAG: type III-B CRISPR-associated protein Cas10/Cmr2, partial [Desulfobacterales bacterium]|nr:type III-B CRISPR-associated protein Cas10/Cmr2 [Desulfobacterales bacterium]